jgi:hypothetical protein
MDVFCEAEPNPLVTYNREGNHPTVHLLQIVHLELLKFLINNMYLVDRSTSNQ